MHIGIYAHMKHFFRSNEKKTKWAFQWKLIPRIGGAEIQRNERERKKTK